jgi:hypothetical protein
MLFGGDVALVVSEILRGRPQKSHVYAGAVTAMTLSSAKQCARRLCRAIGKLHRHEIGPTAPARGCICRVRKYWNNVRAGCIAVDCKTNKKHIGGPVMDIPPPLSTRQA